MYVIVLSKIHVILGRFFFYSEGWIRQQRKNNTELTWSNPVTWSLSVTLVIWYWAPCVIEHRTTLVKIPSSDKIFWDFTKHLFCFVVLLQSCRSSFVLICYTCTNYTWTRMSAILTSILKPQKVFKGNSTNFNIYKQFHLSTFLRF